MNNAPRFLDSHTPQAAPRRPMYKEFALSTSLALGVGYVIVLPPGRVGAVWALTSLGTALLACNRATLTAYLLLFGTSTFGTLAVSIGLPGFGGKAAGAMGLLLAISDPGFLRMMGRLQRPLLWIGWAGLVLIGWYYLGPRTNYCQHLLVQYFLAAPTALVGFGYLFWKPSIDGRAIGQSCLASSLAVLAFGVMLEPDLLPQHAFDVAAIRELDLSSPEERSPVSAHDLARLAAMGAIFMVCTDPDRPLGRRDRAYLTAGLITGVFMLGWAFNRLHLVAFAGSLALAPLARPVFKTRYRAVALISVLMVGVAAVTGFANESGFVMRVLDNNQSLASRLNRSTNWEAGVYLIQEKPWLGHGLGGYYIPGYSTPGSGSFAHNLVLDLLTNLGIVGTSIALAPVLFLVGPMRRASLARLRTSSGVIMIPILCVFLMEVMISGQLMELPGTIAILSVAVMNSQEPEAAPTWQIVGELQGGRQSHG